MKLKIKRLEFLARKPVSMMNIETAKKLSLHIGNRISIKANNKSMISIVDRFYDAVKKDEIVVSDDIFKYLKLRNNQYVDVKIIKKPQSISLIKKKLDGKRLSKKEILQIVKSIADNSLTEVEIAFFISAVHTKGMSLKEVEYLTKAMVETGKKIKLKGRIADKHSIGGVAGNRTTPIVVSICAAAGLKIPKTSSRAITSAAGTADTIETIARVEFSVDEIKKIFRKTNACFVWGGVLGLAPVDDKIVRIERITNIDSESQLLASILSKKISVGSKYVLIDIPYGKSAKVTKKQAEKLKTSFMHLGKKFDLEIKVILSEGSEPIGNGIGPVLEIKDVIKVLKRKNSPRDLESKSVHLAGELLELTGKAKPGKGEEIAKEILDSKRAYEKFKEIIIAQSGNPNKKFKKPEFSHTIKTKRKAKIKHIDNKLINKLARHAGCPEDKLAGIYLFKKKNQEIQKNDSLLTIYTMSKEKLKHAKKFYKENSSKIITFY